MSGTAQQRAGPRPTVETHPSPWLGSQGKGCPSNPIVVPQSATGATSTSSGDWTRRANRNTDTAKACIAPSRMRRGLAGTDPCRAQARQIRAQPTSPGTTTSRADAAAIAPSHPPTARTGEGYGSCAPRPCASFLTCCRRRAVEVRGQHPGPQSPAPRYPPTCLTRTISDPISSVDRDPARSRC